jgi:hypothetical protein
VKTSSSLVSALQSCIDQRRDNICVGDMRDRFNMFVRARDRRSADTTIRDRTIRDFVERTHPSSIACLAMACSLLQ